MHFSLEASGAEKPGRATQTLEFKEFSKGIERKNSGGLQKSVVKKPETKAAPIVDKNDLKNLPKEPVVRSADPSTTDVTTYSDAVKSNITPPKDSKNDVTLPNESVSYNPPKKDTGHMVSAPSDIPKANLTTVNATTTSLPAPPKSATKSNVIPPSKSKLNPFAKEFTPASKKQPQPTSPQPQTNTFFTKARNFYVDTSVDISQNYCASILLRDDTNSSQISPAWPHDHMAKRSYQQIIEDENIPQPFYIEPRIAGAIPVNMYAPPVYQVC
eukprot:TRINITY_DN1848_c0_g1_i1.p1 TRINITY_DN1848_c0_g1~~TRINITY_DN1848_c0_g1_i1.p1  ORF type:complete len:271 (-),score=55.45 TRINITY_DN1848_c0_g1_i1:345-1157(-)